MKNSKKLPTKQLEKFSTVFMQLGLVLTLFIVYTLLEHQTEIKSLAYEPPSESEQIYLPEAVQDVIYKKEPKVKPKIKVAPSKIIDLSIIDKVEDTFIETIIIDKPDKEPLVLDIDKVVFIDEPKAPEPETVPYILIEDAPIFKGCEGLSKEENKKCFEKSITKFVLRNFDAGLAQELGLHSGKHKMYSQFIIDKKGDIIDIVVKAPHKQLEKEAKRIISKLPQFTPGKQQRKPVKVKYTLPISFNVE